MNIQSKNILAVDNKVLRLMLKAIQKKLKIPILRTIIFSNEDEQKDEILWIFCRIKFVS